MRVTIDRLGHLGDGIAQGPDGPVYAAGLLPGEVAEGALSGDRLADLRIVTPSPHRVRPPCAHARSCGGCQLQHVSDGFLASWKQGVVAQALAQQGWRRRSAAPSPPRPPPRGGAPPFRGGAPRAASFWAFTPEPAT